MTAALLFLIGVGIGFVFGCLTCVWDERNR